MTRLLRGVGLAGLELCETTGEMWFLLVDTCKYMINPFGRKGLRGKEAVFQMLRLGVRSLPLVILVNVLLGAIVAISMADMLSNLGVIEWVASVVGMAVTRELGPLMTALMMSGFAGAAIAAELGSMSVAEEITALKAQALNPVYFLVAPRIAALLLMMPVLVLVADLVGMGGGFLVGVGALHIDPSTYIQGTLRTITNADILKGVLIKAEVYGLIIGLVSCHLGLKARGGPEGVGNNATKAVVRTIVLIIAANLVLTTLFNYTFAGAGATMDMP